MSGNGNSIEGGEDPQNEPQREENVAENGPNEVGTPDTQVVKPWLFHKDHHRLVILVLCIFETIFMSGILYGWNGLVPVWTTMGVFGCSDNSTSEDTNASYSSSSEPPVMTIRKPCQQKNDLSTAFIVTSFFQFAITIFCGKFFDHFGLRVTKCLTSVIFFVSCIFMGLVSSKLPWFLYPGGMLLSVAASFTLLCNFQYAELFPGKESTIAALISGCFDSSAIVFLIFRYSFDGHIPIMASFFILGVAALILMNVFGIFLLTSDIKTLVRAVTNTAAAAAVAAEERQQMMPNNQSTDPEPTTVTPTATQTPKTLWEVIRGRHYILQLVWFSCILLRFQFFLAAIPQHFAFRFTDGHPAIGRLYQALNIFLLCGCIFAPGAGFIVDKLKKRGSGDVSDETLKSIGIVEIICSSTAVILTLFIFIDGEAIFYILFLLEAFMRSFLFSLNAAFSFAHYPPEHYGVLFGLMFLIGGLFSAVQFAILRVSIITSNIIVLILCLVSFVQPINLIISSRASTGTDNSAGAENANNNGNAVEMGEHPNEPPTAQPV